MQIWKKLGLIFSPGGEFGWMKTHAAVPFIEKTDEGIKIYFSTRNSENKSQIGWILVDNKNLFKILKISKTPLLKLGDIGFFDYDGTMGCQIINVNEKKILYYIGWNLGVAVPFRNAIGAAFYDSIKNKFIKISEGPLIDRNIYDKCFVSSNCVIKDKKKYRMYYQSCSKWEYKNDELQHYYNIKYAESLDGINWIIRGHTAIDFKYPNEYAICVPRVIKENGIYKMWYSFRGGFKSSKYRIGYAESLDGVRWKRKDEEVNLEVSNNGWDSEMICYPYVFHHEKSFYMLYNGNDYGKTGFGLAVIA